VVDRFDAVERDDGEWIALEKRVRRVETAQ